MFRISKAFENDQIEMITIEGEIKDCDASDWAEALQSILSASHRQSMLNFCGTSMVSAKAIEILIHQMTEHIFLLNCPTAMQNLVHAAGFSKQVVE